MLLRLFCSICILSLPAAAQEPARIGQTFGQWTVSCEAIGVGRTSCILEQSLYRREDGAFVAQALLFWNADGQQSFVGMRVPLGAYLPAGAEMRAAAEEEPMRLAWQTCVQQFCEAVQVLGLDRIEALAQGDAEMLGGYQPAIGRDPIVFAFSMAGAFEGMQALRPGTR
ncbi:MAG: invasion associated locus B family protein [Paracoccaceae bacterium]